MIMYVVRVMVMVMREVMKEVGNGKVMMVVVDVMMNG